MQIELKTSIEDQQNLQITINKEREIHLEELRMVNEDLEFQLEFTETLINKDKHKITKQLHQNLIIKDNPPKEGEK